MTFLRELPWGAWWLLGLVSLSGFLLRWWAGDHFLVTRLVNYLMPWFLVPLIPGLLLAALTHRIWLAVLLAGPTIAIILTYAPLFSPVFSVRSQVPQHPTGPVLRVMSFNVWSKNFRLAEMARVIGEQQPDILLLQEIDSERLAALRAALVDHFPETELHWAGEISMLQAVISRYPVVPVESLRKKGKAQIVTILAPSGPVTVFNVHPLRTGGWKRRHREMTCLLEEEILGTPGPLILGGDFNTTDQTQIYRRLSRHLLNAHWEAGFGFGFTYPSADIRLFGFPIPPLVRIDHLFYSRHFQALSARTLPDSGGSDHYPVVAELTLSDD